MRVLSLLPESCQHPAGSPGVNDFPKKNQGERLLKCWTKKPGGQQDFMMFDVVHQCNRMKTS